MVVTSCHWLCNTKKPFLSLVVLFLASFEYRACHGAARSEKPRGPGTKLFCNISVACTPCGYREMHNAYCKETGYKEELDCVATPKHGLKYQVVLTDSQPSKDDTSLIILHRSCPQPAAVTGAQDAQTGTNQNHISYMNLFHFELIMLMMLGLALPVVYWRKKKIWHL